jgi:hypothetical protein
MWQATFRNIYVVSAEEPGSELAVRRDDGPVVQTTLQPGEDASTATFEVRTSSAHRITAIGKDGRELTYDLDPATAKHGWAIAPHGRAQGLCLASLTWHYGTAPKESDDALLGDGADLIVLPRKFDHVLTPPPATVQVDSGSTTTRTALRALACTSLEHDAIVSSVPQRGDDAVADAAEHAEDRRDDEHEHRRLCLALRGRDVTGVLGVSGLHGEHDADDREDEAHARPSTEERTHDVEDEREHRVHVAARARHHRSAGRRKAARRAEAGSAAAEPTATGRLTEAAAAATGRRTAVPATGRRTAVTAAGRRAAITAAGRRAAITAAAGRAVPARCMNTVCGRDGLRGLV